MKKRILLTMIFLIIITLIPVLVFIEPKNYLKTLPKEQQAKYEYTALYKKMNKKNENERYFNIFNIHTNEVEKVLVGDYLKGVVAAEMPVNFHIEALKAQAIAAHTYALNLINKTNGLANGADFSNDPNIYQAYLNVEQAQKKFGNKFDEYWNKISQAVDEVSDKVVVYDNQLITAVFHSTSGGKTESSQNIWGGNLPYLQPVESIGDKNSPNYNTKQSFQSSQVEKILKNKFSSISLPEEKQNWFNITSRSNSDTVLEASVGGQIFSGDEIRNLFKLKSANFYVNYDNGTDQFIFDTYGYGHGIGMSQYGADYLAQQGYTYEQILTHYYQGTSVLEIK